MPVTSGETDTGNLTFTIVTELDATPERLWQMWADPRLLEQWWGPPGYPATFEEHDLSEGGKASYFMTGPEGEKYPGRWLILKVEQPYALEIQDGFADDAGEQDESLPASVFRVTIEVGEGSDSPTRMTIRSQFESIEEMEKLIEMGMVEGMTAAMNQIDSLL